MIILSIYFKTNIKNRINFIGNGDDKEILDVFVLLTEINLEESVSSKTQFVINEVVLEINSLDESFSISIYRYIL